MSNTPTIFTVITTKLNAGQNAANTGAGAQNPDGSFNVTGTVLGTAQTVHAGIELATLGKTVGSAIPVTGGLLSFASAAVAADKIQKDWSSGKAISQSDVAALVGSAAGMGGAVIILMGASGPIVVTLAAAATVTSVAAGAYQLNATAKGLTVDAATGRTVEVALTPAQMAQIDQHMQQTMPLWNQTSTLPELGFVTGTKLQTVGSVFSAAASNTNNAPAPSGLDTPTRNSAALINTTGAHTTQFNSGGGVDDLWVVEKNAGRYVGTREQFRTDFVASNGQVDPKTLVVQQNQTYFVPQRSANGNTTYHYSNGAVVTNNAVSGEYRMVVNNTDGGGGQTVYTRTYDTQTAQFTVTQVQTNAAGTVVYDFTGRQSSLSVANDHAWRLAA